MIGVIVLKRLGWYGGIEIDKVKKIGTHPCSCSKYGQELRPGREFFQIQCHGASKDHSNFYHNCFFEVGGEMRKATSRAQRIRDVANLVAEEL